MNNTINETPNIHAKYFTIQTTGDNIGRVSLNCTDRSQNVNGWPDVLVIPETVTEIQVTSLDPGMFADNTYIKEITFPTSVTQIPQDFCRNAVNLRAIHNTSQITNLGATAFMNTRIRKAWFPSLEVMNTTKDEKDNDVGGAFLGCAYLEFANIGQVTTIPERTFANCALLREVTARNTVTSIKTWAFYQTRSLRELPLLADVTTVSANAFLYSRICTSLPVVGNIMQTAFPAAQHTLNFWSGVPFTPCRNRLVTKLSHLNATLTDETLLTNKNSRAFFAVMHIHSAITGKYYSHPDEFVSEFRSPDLSQRFNNGWTGTIENVCSLFTALGYQTEIHGNSKTLDSKDYKALVDALAHGAYVYTQMQTQSGSNDLHGVAIYGINDLGEVCVLDSNILHESFRESGFEPGIDVYTYTMPYQNLVYPHSDFIIVYPTKEDVDVEWTCHAAENTFNSSSKPSDYPENRVTICSVTGDSGTPGSAYGILTAYRVGGSAYRTFVPDGEATLYLQYKEDDDSWSENWTESNQKDFTWLSCNQIVESTIPSEVPLGVSACVVSRSDSGLPANGVGYLMAYHLQYTENGDTKDIIREEWQPINSNKKYVRYPGSTTPWGDWSVFTPGDGDTQPDDTSSESQ